ncbi:archease [Sulfurivermis fontis]|jgi:tRNA nucleotidyltransferase (CCA-adding enzyme)|uniref:archease n=1 Tax=Sulfurivermis fontis TaxID=1972068 RepID=UPI000FDB388A|nr:archease [Sulfurivermis fontis]
MTASWQHFSHEADIGIAGIAPDLAGAFAQAALALTAVICDPQRVRPERLVEIACTAPDRELLLVDWLNALIYEMAVRHMLFSRFEVQLDGTRLRARAWGEPVDVTRHRPAVEVKGATYTELGVFQDVQGLWHAQCVVDV